MYACMYFSIVIDLLLSPAETYTTIWFRNLGNSESLDIVEASDCSIAWLCADDDAESSLPRKTSLFTCNGEECGRNA